MAFDVFISYSSQDRTVANAVCAVLEQEGVRCWIAPRDIEAGRDWAGSIIAALNECSIMVLVFSSHANGSPQVRREVQRAFEKSVTVIPFRVEDVMPAETLEYYIGPVHWLDALSQPMDEHLRKLADVVKRNVTSRSGRIPSAAPEEAPAGSNKSGAKKRRKTPPIAAAPGTNDTFGHGSPSQPASPAEVPPQGTGMPSVVRAEFENVRKMAELTKDPSTMVRLARMYRDGHLGDWGKDDHRAVEWFRWAAETATQGSWLGARFSDHSHAHAEAMNALGEMYEQGRGVTQDVNEAIRWYREAAKRWFSDAAKTAKASLVRLGVAV